MINVVVEYLGTTDTLEKEKLSLAGNGETVPIIQGAAIIIAMEKGKPEQLLFPSQEMFILVSN